MTVPTPRPARLLAALLVLAAAGAAGCGRADNAGSGTAGPAPKIGIKGTSGDAQDLGFPTFATKNTNRLAGADPIADAAAAAQIVTSSPAAVTLVDAGDWRAATAAAALFHAPIGAPILFTQGAELPDATRQALAALDPRGSKAAGGAKVIRVGTTAVPGSMATTDIRGKDPFALARALDAFAAAARGVTGHKVLVVSADDPQYAAPAAAWAAKSGDPVLFTHKDVAPPDTVAAIRAHGKKTRIYVLGPSTVISPKVTQQLGPLGTIYRVGGQDPVSNAINFARYSDARFGWGITDPGHGMVMIPQSAAPATPAAVSALSASGAYGPALLLSSATQLDDLTRAFLLDIQPGYAKDPVRGVYNRAWLIGDTRAITPALQSEIDRNLEIKSIASKGARP